MFAGNKRASGSALPLGGLKFRSIFGGFGRCTVVWLAYIQFDGNVDRGIAVFYDVLSRFVVSIYFARLW